MKSLIFMMADLYYSLAVKLQTMFVIGAESKGHPWFLQLYSRQKNLEISNCLEMAFNFSTENADKQVVLPLLIHYFSLQNTQGAHLHNWI